MSRTDLRLDLPTGSWLGDVSRSVPPATLRVAETIAVGVDSSATGGNTRQTADDDPEAIATVLVAGTERDRAEDALRDHEAVERATTVERRGEVRTLRVAGRAPVYLPAARAVGLPIESTVEVVDGRATVTVVGDRDRIEAFGRRLTGDGVTVGVAATDAGDPDRTLTEAQRELVFEAVRAGYYDTPRRCTLTELAEANEIAKSTCSETLHRAEGRVMRRFVDGEGAFASGADVGDAVTAETAPPEEPPLDEGEFDVDDADELDASDREEPVRSAATEP
ncbi:helix-turn-helix domain-containing protein [Halorubrum sp. SP3]|uniref:helix-turn-helix domain-containing protein n=1 Tax=unclassified Halorubrum TaxID=2642239 RepID=UPI0010F7D81E|nr:MULTISPECIES: helix-turn-helix domain-containing protein [unclassified Halorubrum]TKX55445.1 helix-turn-helix domain-containing protein [Halorubrum sp. SP3]TKX70650.1 helix-turn-helix domain-containing protein [Halorubrum sp. SP9]